MLRVLGYSCLFILLIALMAFFAGSISLVKEYSFDDSGDIVNREDLKEDSIHSIFVGDIMLDRGVASSIKKVGKNKIFAGIENLFHQADVVIGNFEGTMSSRQSIAVPGSTILRFTFDPSFAPILRSAGFTAFSLANNHSLDFGQAGYIETRDYIHANNILTFGSALNNLNISTAIPIKDQTFCLVGYHDLYVADPSSVLAEINSIRPNCSKVIVFVHWGIEYSDTPSDRQRILAQGFIDAGADLIIGAHPHVVQPVEIYKGKAIFYSLGNFVFDQNFSFETMHGLLVDIKWGRDNTYFKLVPVAINKGQVTIADSEAGSKVIKSVIGNNLTRDMISEIQLTSGFVLGG